MTVAIAWRNDTTLRGIGGWVNGAGHQSITAFTATASSETLTFVSANNMLHYQNADHSITTDLTITEIIGIV